MPRSGGQYYLPSPPLPFQPNSLAAAEDVNTALQDIGQALTDSLPRDGSAALTGPLNMNGQNLTGVGTFSAASISSSGPLSGASLAVSGGASINYLSGPLNANGQNITGAGTLSTTTLSVSGNETVSGAITAGSLHTTGNTQVDGTITTSHDVTVAGNIEVNTQGISYNGSNLIGFHWAGDGVHIIVDGTDENYLIGTHGDATYTPVYGIAVASGGYMAAWFRGGAGVATWPVSWSDRRLKTNIQPAELDALGTLNRLTVYQADYTPPVDNAVPQHLECALIADEIAAALPSAYVAPVQPGSYEQLRELPLIATLVRAVQQLTARLDALEHRPHSTG